MKLFNFIKFNTIMAAIIILLLFLAGCNNSDNTTKYYDELGYERDRYSTIYGEALLLNDANYKKYSDKLLGDSGESGLVNKEILDTNNSQINDKGYFVLFYYGYNSKNNIGDKDEINTFFRISMSDNTGISFDNDVIDVGKIDTMCYKVTSETGWIVSTYMPIFDLDNDSFSRITFEPSGFGICISVIPFSIKKEGKLNIDIRIASKYFKYDKTLLANTTSETKDDLIEISNYTYSFVSEKMVNDGISQETPKTDQNFYVDQEKFFIVEFDIKTLRDNDGEDYFELLIYLKNDEISFELEEAPSATFDKTQEQEFTKISTWFKVQREKNTSKHYRLIYKIVSKVVSNNEMYVLLTSNKLSINNIQRSLIITNTYNDVLMYRNDGEYCVVLGARDDAITDLVIPGYHDGKQVRISGSSFENYKNLREVIIEEGVKKIGDRAFYDCTQLKVIDLPNSIETIGKSAFENCSLIKDVNLSDNIIEIGKNAFLGCDNSLFFEDSDYKYLKNKNNNYYTLVEVKDRNKETYSINSNVKILSSYIFEGCSNLKEISIPGNVTIIPRCAFYNCLELKNVNISDGIKSIGEIAFCNCPKLESINFPSSLEIIYTQAFYNCSSLEQVKLNSGIKKLENGIFWKCSSLKNVYIPDSIEELDENVFLDCDLLEYNHLNKGCYLGNDDNKYLVLVKTENKDFSSFEINDNCKIICNNAFYECKAMKEIVIPDSVIDIGKNAFDRCFGLENVKLPNHLTKLKTRVFSYCTLLNSIELPKDLEIIEFYAFSNCTSLIQIKMHNSITEIMSNAFYECSRLVKIYYEGSEEEWDLIDKSNLKSKIKIVFNYQFE